MAKKKSDQFSHPVRFLSVATAAAAATAGVAHNGEWSASSRIKRGKTGSLS